MLSAKSVTTLASQTEAIDVSQRKLRVNESRKKIEEAVVTRLRIRSTCQFSVLYSIAKVRALFSPTPYRLYSKIALRHGYIGVSSILNINVLTSNPNVKSHNFYRNNRHHGKRSRNGSAPYHIRSRKGCPRPSLSRGDGRRACAIYSHYSLRQLLGRALPPLALCQTARFATIRLSRDGGGRDGDASMN